MKNTSHTESSQLIHTAYFWLKHPESQADRDALITGLKTLAEIPLVNQMHIGLPASTEQREAVDNSFHVSELIFFDNVTAQDAYQAHPIHLAFVEACSHLWAKVKVRDSISL